MTPQLYLHNSLTKQKELFQPANPARVSMYVCGPTVYNYAHIGNARPAVVFDVLSRLLRQLYPKLIYVRNFTDVDDKINAAAIAQGVPINQITSKFIDAYHEDMVSLGVLPPDIEPCVTEHIDDIIEMLLKLIDNGHAYLANDHIVFHVPSYEAYGQLSGRNRKEMIAGARVEVAPFKRDPADFVLWKPSSPEMPGWDSPWGRGRPGWHIECTAMIARHLGTSIDLHGGGQDLIFPHHENEIAQGTCAHGEQYCRYWVHNGFITVNGQKMSKSLGNVLLVRDLLQQYDGETMRLAILMTHYRHSLDWTAQVLHQAKLSVQRFYRAMAAVQAVSAQPAHEDWEKCFSKLCNDLNTPDVIAMMHGWASEALLANGPISKDAKRQNPVRQGQLKTLFMLAGQTLGILQKDPHQALQQASVNFHVDHAMKANIEALVSARQQARDEGDFAKADSIRHALLNMNVALKDHADTTSWELVE